MIQKVLDNCLRPIIAAETQLRNRKLMSWVLILGALIAAIFIALATFLNWWSWPAIFGLLGAMVLALIVGAIWSNAKKPDLRELAHRVETKHPDLRSALLAAMDQEPRPDGSLGYLQSRLLGDVTEHAVKTSMGPSGF